MASIHFSRLTSAVLVSLCVFNGAANAATPAEIEAGHDEATFRLIAVHCGTKSFAKEFLTASKKFVRSSFANAAEVEKLASGRAPTSEGIATASRAECDGWMAQMRTLMDSRAKNDAMIQQLIKKSVK